MASALPLSSPLVPWSRLIVLKACKPWDLEACKPWKGLDSIGLSVGDNRHLAIPAGAGCTRTDCACVVCLLYGSPYKQRVLAMIAFYVAASVERQLFCFLLSSPLCSQNIRTILRMLCSPMKAKVENVRATFWRVSSRPRKIIHTSMNLLVLARVFFHMHTDPGQQ